MVKDNDGKYCISQKVSQLFSLLRRHLQIIIGAQVKFLEDVLQLLRLDEVVAFCVVPAEHLLCSLNFRVRSHQLLAPREHH